MPINNDLRGTAIYIRVCPHTCCPNRNRQVHHLTLAYLKTKNAQIISLALARIKKCIQINYYVENYKKNNFTCKQVTYKIGDRGPNSTFFEGNVKEFKHCLDNYLRINPIIAPYLGDYRPAHVDRFNRSVQYYPVFRLNNLLTM